MTLLIFVMCMAVVTLWASESKDRPDPVWELGKSFIDPAMVKGKVALMDGAVTLSGTNSFSLPASLLGEQNDYTVEFEVRRPVDSPHGAAIVLFSNMDAEAGAGLEYRYYPAAYNCGWILKNGHNTVEQRDLLDDGFSKITLVVKDRQLMQFRNGLLLAMTDTVNPSSALLRFGGEVNPKLPPREYVFRKIRIYRAALVPAGFDPSVEPMRNYSGDQYFIQRVDVKDPTLPRILVVGDSISMGYRPYITEHFKGRAYVDYWIGGAWFDRTVKGDDFPLLRGWDGVLSNGPYHVVSWNAMTLHMWTPQDTGRCLPDKYPAQMTRVVDHLQKTAPDTRFIWVRCTPYTVPADGGPSVIDAKKSERLGLFNALTDEIMKQHGIPEIDLWALCEKHLDKADKDGVHWAADGYKLMADEISREIDALLTERRP